MQSGGSYPPKWGACGSPVPPNLQLSISKLSESNFYVAGH